MIGADHFQYLVEKESVAAILAELAENAVKVLIDIIDRLDGQAVLFIEFPDGTKDL